MFTCRACRGRGTVYCPGGECRCAHCDGTGQLSACPVCQGRHVVELHSFLTGASVVVPCGCVAVVGHSDQDAMLRQGEIEALAAD